MKFQVETVIIALNAITTSSSAAAFNEPVAVALPTATSSKAEPELADYERNLGADNEGEGQPLGIPMPTTTRLRGRNSSRPAGFWKGQKVLRGGEGDTSFGMMTPAFEELNDGRELFSGADLINGNPWYHEVLTEEALSGVGFAEEAADHVGWHAEYVDTYLYNPIWWLKGLVVSDTGLDRLKASLGNNHHLAAMHFDDLGATAQVQAMWQRYMNGCLVGLFWAAEIYNGTYVENLDPIGAGHNLLGVSIHAIQDFYSHSNWIDDANRRLTSFLEFRSCDIEGMALYTGSYEDEFSSVKPHGKISVVCTVKESATVVKFIGEIYCGILNNDSDICREFKDCEEIEARALLNAKALGVDIGSILYYEPGIAVDNEDIAKVAIKERGIENQISATDAMDVAKSLAINDTIAFVKLVEAKMLEEGFGDFWNALKNSTSTERKEDQYEKFNHFPFQFVGQGPLPKRDQAQSDYDNGYYLRVILKTSDDIDSGTNADIKLIGDGTTFNLDYQLPVPMEGNIAANILAYNDFEAGDETAYTVGPFAAFPSSIAIKNDAPDFGDYAAAAWNEVKRFFGIIFDDIFDIFTDTADYIGTKTFRMDPSYINAIAVGSFRKEKIRIDGGSSDGVYDITFTVARLDDENFQVKNLKFKCIEESNELSAQDEPFAFIRLDSYPGNSQFRKVGPWSTDAGDTKSFPTVVFDVTLNNGLGAMALTFAMYESDQEGAGRRNEAYAKFRGVEIEDKFESFWEVVSEGIGQDWKIEWIKVYAFRRGGDSLESGQVLHDKNKRWIEGGKSRSFPLDEELLKVRQGINLQTCEPTSMPSLSPSVSKTPSFSPSVSKKPSLSPSLSKTPSFAPSISQDPTQSKSSKFSKSSKSSKMSSQSSSKSSKSSISLSLRV